MAKRKPIRRKRKTTPTEPIIIDDSFEGLVKLARKRIQEANAKKQSNQSKSRKRMRRKTTRRRRVKQHISIFDLSLKKVIAELFLFWLAYKVITYYFF